MAITGKTREKIIRDIENHILTCPGKYYSEFSIETCEDPIMHLFTELKLDRKKGCWSYHRAIDISTVYEVVKNLMDKGMKGTLENIGNRQIYVCCYQESSKVGQLFI